MKEHLRPGPGFGIIGRWVYPNQTDRQRVLKADTYFLAPGEGVVFVGTGDNPEQAIKFKQSELPNILRETDLTTIQLMAIVEQQSGGLLFTDGTPDHSYGIGKPTPKNQRVMIATYGRITFAGIWGESKEEASARLAKLQRQRLMRN